MKLRAGVLASAFLALAAVHCNGATVPLGGGDPKQTVAQSGGDAGAEDVPTFDPPPAGVTPLTRAQKVDIVLAVDNSPGMAAKSKIFARSIAPFLEHVAAAAPDVHLGVITSSLGNMGGNVCPTSNPRTDDDARLQRTDGSGAVVTNSAGFLEYKGGLVTDFTAKAQLLVEGVGETGCGLEAQLESVYRFLVQPDPWAVVTRDAFQQADVGFSSDVDVAILQQRAAFLRPDSLVVVLMVTDEDDSAADPLSVGGFGYAFMSTDFPGSPVLRAQGLGHTAPRGTAACDTNPGSADCTSCGFAANCDANTVSCQVLKQDPNCTDQYSGFYAPDDDDINVRFHRMKERYGVDPQYPIARYVAGFSASSVPQRGTEHVVTTNAAGKRDIANYTYRKTCTNPLFAASLPQGVQGDEICHLARGPRTPEQIVFGLIGGGSPALLEQGSVNWTAVLGADADHFDYTGIDPHMIQSVAPRAALIGSSEDDPNAPRGSNGTDPVDGREWRTNKRDLQYACTFDLEAELPCPANASACDCLDDPSHALGNPPLCKKDGTAVQVKGKAYPSVRELRLAKQLGARATVGSICPTSAGGDYEPFLARFENVVLPRLGL